MKRDIKFRVWDGEEMIILENSGLQYYDFEGSYSLGFTVDAYSGFWAHEQYDTATKRAEAFPIMQYAGGKDLNQKEVYEGDIFIGYEERDGKRLSGKFIVEWEDHAFVAKSIEENGCDAWLSFFFSNDNTVPQTAIEVIGNIHQNPELLKPTSESNTLPK